MSTLVLDNTPPQLTAAESAATLVADATSGPTIRSAFYLTSRNEPLSAWLHLARERANLDHGVVICAPLGFEQLHANRSLRHLADALAAQGIPTLRFDWHGTADSAGSDADRSRRATWQANVRDAVTWLRNTLGCKHVSLVGLRLGAMLAVEALGSEALENGDCDNLVLWSPVVCGKSYMRQMQTIEQLAESRPRPDDAGPADVEAAGYLISDETAGQLAKCNLLQKELSCRHGLLVGPFDKRLIDRFAQFEIPVDTISHPGFAEMMAEPHFSQVPRQTITEIAAWLGSKIRAAAPAVLAPSPQLTGNLGPQQTIIAQQTSRSESASWVNVRERLVRAGGEVDLFGVVCEPTEPIMELPTIVLLNSGAANHIGPGRLYVELARRLAVQGFRSLRLDALGLGDSVPRDVADENNPYPSSVFRDVELAVAELKSRYGAEKFVLMGLCSGAYASFQAAAQLRDPTIIESVLINPLTFHWEDGMPFDASGAEKLLEEHRKMARASNPKKLLQFLCGKTEIGYGEALKLITKRIARRLSGSPKARPIEGSATTGDVLGHPRTNDLARDLSRVAAHGRKLAMFLAENDPGYAVMMYHAPRETKQSLRSGALQLTKIDGGDHTFSRRVPREKLIRAVAEYLQARYPKHN